MSDERQARINELMLDMIANTDCSWAAATAAVAFWEHHRDKHTAPVYGLVNMPHNSETCNVIFDNGDAPRSLKVGVQCERDEVWFMTILS